MTKKLYLTFRGAIDRVLAAGLLLIALPVIALVALAVRLRLGSPVLFRQERVGRYGKVFRIVKFRTMVRDAERLGGGYMPSELNLVPPLGAFLRRSSLDELPQLLNILRGEMSFVGPRPALPDQYARYTKEQAQRVVVPQGLTGLAQVRYRNNATLSTRIEADLEYIERVGPILDAVIWLRTFSRVFKREGVRLDQTVHEVDDLNKPEVGEKRYD